MTVGLHDLSDDALRRLANNTNLDPAYLHAIDAELVYREQQQELAAFAQRMQCAGPDEVHAEEHRWCCRRGDLADAHRAVLAQAEDRLAANRTVVAA